MAAGSDRRIIGGVDTHKDLHVVAAIVQVGAVLGTASFPTTPAAYRRLLAWLRRQGPLEAVGVEGTGSWGAGLARHLAASGVKVIEVNRPNRQNRRRRGKSDTVDAEAAAWAVLSGDATAVPKASEGNVECIRLLRVARRGALKERIQAGLQLQSLVDTAPEPLRAGLRDLTVPALAARAARFRPGPADQPTEAAKRALASIARRWLAAGSEIDTLNKLHLWRFGYISWQRSAHDYFEREHPQRLILRCSQ